MPRKVNFSPGAGMLRGHSPGMTSVLLTWQETTLVTIGGFCARGNARCSKSLSGQVEGAS